MTKQIPAAVRRWSAYLAEAGLELYVDVRRTSGGLPGFAAESAPPPVHPEPSVAATAGSAGRPVAPEPAAESGLAGAPSADGAQAANEPVAATASAPEAPDLAPETLAQIRADLGDCRRCGLCETRRSIVFGEGNPAARLMFVGEGPGADEDASGRPFVGAAGQLLDRMIAAMGLQRDEVYIANIVKCRPPGNRDPEPPEVAACLPFLERQIRAVAPEVIVTLGRPAARWLLGYDGPISRIRGDWQRWGEVAVMPTFHPAYLLRDPGKKREAWQDLQAAMQRLGLSPAGGT